MPRARSRRQAPEAEEPSKAWLDSYADAMTLLLAFFILLYASSLIDEDKFIDFKVGVAEALGNPSPVLDGGDGILDRGNGVASLVAAPPAVNANADGADDTNDPSERETDDVEEFLGTADEVTTENAEELVAALEQRIAEVGAADFVEVVADPRGVVIRFDSQVLFRSGDARILPDGVLVMESVADALRSLDNLLVVEGHTDDVPTDGTQWPSNWELSVTRSTNVLRYLTEIEGVAPARISAAGYADTRPRATNGTAHGRALNRRVEIVILVTSPAGDPAPSPTGDRPRVDTGIGDPVGIDADPTVFLDLDPAPVEPAE